MDSRYTLLLAEDEARTDPTLVLLFEQAGFDVDVATTGLEAARLLEQKSYDAVVLDNMMPPGDEEGSEWSLEKTQGGLHTGLNILKKIADMTSPPPVWIVTALPDDDIETQETSFAFVQGFLKKPASLKRLAEDIREYLRHKEGCNRSAAR